MLCFGSSAVYDRVCTRFASGYDRPPGLSKQAKATAMAAETLYREGRLSVQEICDQLGISKPTLYAYLRLRGVAVGARKGDPQI